MESALTVDLLAAVREGSAARLQLVLTDPTTGQVHWDRPCRYGTALHMAAYFGQAPLVQLLLDNGADINLRNDEGDTPLHKAALTGRVAVLNLLLRHPKIDFTVENKNAQSALSLAKNREVSLAIEQTQQAYVEESGRQLIDSGRVGDWARVQTILSQGNSKLLSLNQQDRLSGNTLLHYVAAAGQKELVAQIIQRGADPTIANRENKPPAGVARTDNIRLLLQNAANSDGSTIAPEMIQVQGMLFRWGGYALGWRKRWFVIENGMLFLYNSREEVRDGPRGTIRLAGATVIPGNNDDRVFTVRGRNATTYYLRADTTRERASWLQSLKQAARATDKGRKALTDGDLKFAESFDVFLTNLRVQCQSLEKQLQEATQLLGGDDGTARLSKNINVSATAMINTATKLAQTAEERVAFWQRRCERADRQRQALEESVRLLAIEQSELERRATEMLRTRTQINQTDIDDTANATLHSQDSHSCVMAMDGPNDEDDEFYDAASDENLDGTHDPVVSNPTDLAHTSNASSSRALSASNSIASMGGERSGAIVQRRNKLQAPMKDRNEVSLWTVIKDFIGKDLSKIAVPVYFNEPLSFLQKFAEDLEYYQLLERAAEAPTSLERIQWIAAFAISPYAATTRTAKPFNPILGETFEMKRDDLGYRYFAEQVSHHPPISACHCESRTYTYWAEAHIKNRFLGNTLEVYPSGSFHVVLKKTKEHFVWHRVKTVVHNLIIGTIWVDNLGEMLIKNLATGETALIEFKQKGWWSKGYAEVEGIIKNASGQPQFRVSGQWNDHVEAIPLNYAGTPEENSPPKVLWQRNQIPPENAKYYNFSQFSIELNELLPEMVGRIAPTDSRLRPDQRAMEDGKLDKAVSEKLRLEEKQRKARKLLEERGEEWSPRWFDHVVEPESGETCWIYKGQYWEGRERGQFDNVPDIF